MHWKHRITRGLASSVLATVTMFAATPARVAAAETETAGVAEEAPTLETTLALKTFDTAWQIVRDTHFDPELNGVDWDAVRAELRPQAESADSHRALRGVISDMLGRLGQSHFAVFAGEAVDRLDSFATEDDRDDADGSSGDGVVGLELRLIGDLLTVTRVELGSAADGAGVNTGWVVTQVGERKISELLELVRTEMAEGLYGEEVIVDEVVTDALIGPNGSEVQLHFLDENDEEIEQTLVRRAAKGQVVRFGNLPPMLTRVERHTVSSENGQEVGVVSLSSWMVPAMADLDQALFEFRELDGVIFDLRGNPGGVGAMVMGTAGHFIDEKLDLGTMRMRNNTLRFAVNPRLVNSAGKRVEVFGGPLAILVDGLSASTSEVFAGGMQEVGRARIFGETTMGAVLPAQMERLPSGDVLYHAFAEYQTPSGITLEGRGVLPDEPVTLRRADLLGGRDAALDAALGWIDGETKRTVTPAEMRSGQGGIQ